MPAPSAKSVASAEIADVFRNESGRAVATLVRFFGDIQLAEEAVQDAFVVALERWPQAGVPPAPAGWIITTAKNRGIDRSRREARRDDLQAEAERLRDQRQPGGGLEAAPTSDEDPAVVRDDQLRLMFTCCHPALATDVQVALTLRLIAGLTTAEIARAFLVPEPTLAQRLVRAKRKIKTAHIPYRVPPAAELPGRLSAVLHTIYLVFNEGHVASAGRELGRVALAEKAIRLARLVAELLPEEDEAVGLLGLLLLTHARRSARVDREGRLVRLADQDRSLWDGAAIAEGHALVRQCLVRNRPGPFQIQAAIAAVHADAPAAAATDWRQIVTLYDQLLARTRSPVVALNRAIAVGEAEGAAAALALVDDLADRLDSYHLLHAARADLLERLGRLDEALVAYDRALALVSNGAEREHLDRRRAELGW